VKNFSESNKLFVIIFVKTCFLPIMQLRLQLRIWQKWNCLLNIFKLDFSLSAAPLKSSQLLSIRLNSNKFFLWIHQAVFFMKDGFNLGASRHPIYFVALIRQILVFDKNFPEKCRNFFHLVLFSCSSCDFSVDLRMMFIDCLKYSAKIVKLV